MIKSIYQQKHALKLALKIPLIWTTYAQTVIQLVQPAQMKLAARLVTQVQIVWQNTLMRQLAWMYVLQATTQTPLLCAKSAVIIVWHVLTLQLIAYHVIRWPVMEYCPAINVLTLVATVLSASWINVRPVLHLVGIVQLTKKHAPHVKLAYFSWVQHALLHALRTILQLAIRCVRNVIQTALNVHQQDVLYVMNSGFS